MTPDERARLRASPVLYVAPDCPTCGARDGNAHRDRACLLDAPPEPPSDEIREALDAVKAEHGDVLRALAQSTDGSVQLQAKVDRLERELAEARAERDRLRAALVQYLESFKHYSYCPECGSMHAGLEKPSNHAHGCPIVDLRRALDGEG